MVEIRSTSVIGGMRMSVVLFQSRKLRKKDEIIQNCY